MLLKYCSIHPCRFLFSSSQLSFCALHSYPSFYSTILISLYANLLGSKISLCLYPIHPILSSLHNSINPVSILLHPNYTNPNNSTLLYTNLLYSIQSTILNLSSLHNSLQLSTTLCNTTLFNSDLLSSILSISSIEL